mmetsp:Transcript_11085/g.23904  ORF Transcript_11085/g.23904 Transcript_11085/m.23904 type:complete len:346 (+) Transcript_11085:1156-2193(+)
MQRQRSLLQGVHGLTMTVAVRCQVRHFVRGRGGRPGLGHASGWHLGPVSLVRRLVHKGPLQEAQQLLLVDTVRNGPHHLLKHVLGIGRLLVQPGPHEAPGDHLAVPRTLNDAVVQGQHVHVELRGEEHLVLLAQEQQVRLFVVRPPPLAAHHRQGAVQGGVNGLARPRRDLECEVHAVHVGKLPLEQLVAGEGLVGVIHSLQDQAVRLMAELGDELGDEFAAHIQRPEVLAPHTEGLTLVVVREWWRGEVSRLDAPLNVGRLHRARLDNVRLNDLEALDEGVVHQGGTVDHHDVIGQVPAHVLPGCFVVVHHHLPIQQGAVVGAAHGVVRLDPRPLDLVGGEAHL